MRAVFGRFGVQADSPTYGRFVTPNVCVFTVSRRNAYDNSVVASLHSTLHKRSAVRKRAMIAYVDELYRARRLARAHIRQVLVSVCRLVRMQMMEDALSFFAEMRQCQSRYYLPLELRRKIWWHVQPIEFRRRVE